MLMEIINRHSASVVFVLSCTLFMFGCTSLRAIEKPPDAIQSAIINEQLIKRGDRVKIVTKDGVMHEFTVRSVNQTHVVGRHKKLEISNIISLEFRRISIGKTLLLSGGVVALYIMVIIAAASAMILSAASGP